MDIDLLIKPEYKEMCHSIFKHSVDPFLLKASHLIASGVAKSNAYDILNSYLKKEVGSLVATPEFLENIIVNNLNIIALEEKQNVLLYFVEDIPKKIAIEKLGLQYGVEKVLLILPHQQPQYKMNVRFIIDRILTDGQRMRCTDVHIEPVTDYNGGFEYIVKFRQGLFTEEVTDVYKLDNQMVLDILDDMISNRSPSTFKTAKILLSPETRFRLIDPLYPSRCDIINTIGGPGLVVRFFDFKTPYKIETLGFDKQTERDLAALASETSGLSLVSGVTGSGKGTTLNAIALKIQEQKKYSIISIDSPTEYLGRFPQVEYLSDTHLYQACNAVKKLDRNFVLLNEIATQETALNVYNLVVSGVHVLTSIHNNRVYRVVYKLKEMMGDLYINLIPFMKFLSYQDKFSIACDCVNSVHKDHYNDNPNAQKLLEFFSLEIIKQPAGCDRCNYTGINKNGIQVVSEYIYFSSGLQDRLIRADIHEQASILKAEVMKSVCLEDILKAKLIKGEVLIDEVVVKLDTWRG